MKKNLVNSMFALFALFCSQAIAADQKAPLVCNAAETAKICKGWSDKTELVLGGPDRDRFHSALADCAGPDNYGQQGPQQQLYIDCQNKADIDELRLKANEVDSAKRRNFSWMQQRCSPKYAENRVCGTSIDSTVSSTKDNSNKDGISPLHLTRITPSKPSAEEITRARKEDKNAKIKQTLEAAETKAKLTAGQAKAKQAEDERRTSCMKPENRGMCSCLKYYPNDKGNACGK